MVHTLLSDQEYRITEDSGMQLDEDTSVITRSVSLTFRGSLRKLYQKFMLGMSGGESSQPESGETRLFCAGPSNVRMVPGSAPDPHWDCTVEWIGLHSYTTFLGEMGAIWKMSPNWTTNSFNLPYKTPGGNNINPAPYMGYFTGVDETTPPCTVFESIPSINVRGIVISTMMPHPRMSQLMTLRALLPTVIGATQINDNMIDLKQLGAGNVGYNYCKEMLDGNVPTVGVGPSIGAWRIGDINAERIIEPMNLSGGAWQVGTHRIYVLSFPAIWTPRRSVI